MSTTTVTSAADPGLPARLSDYLSMLQEDVHQLEALLEAANFLTADVRRRDIALDCITGALKIAGELAVALDSVTIRDELASVDREGTAA